MKVFHFSAECYPLAKVGGLADVVGALPKYQNRTGLESSVVMPYYESIRISEDFLSQIHESTLVLDKVSFEVIIYKYADPVLGFDIFLVKVDNLTNRENVYGYDDDPKRFIAFQRAALEWIIMLDDLPDIVHCHDHHSGLIPFMMTKTVQFELLQSIPTILSIHNAQYQGSFEHELSVLLPQFASKYKNLLDWAGLINPLATAIKLAWQVTTVSPTYLKELQQKANGLEGLLTHESDKCVGILNGIDRETWNPNTDEYLYENYSAKTFKKGRKVNKLRLCEDFGLDPGMPLFGFIGRLVWEKGADLLPAAIEKTIIANDMNVILLGSGFADVEEQFKLLKKKFPDKLGLFIGYKEDLSHKIYAGADFLLMPSRVEPCGLNQLYALAYGCMPIVRRTGGLQDTIIDIGDDGLGICHDEASVEDIVHSIERALEIYNNKRRFSQIQKRMMQVDHSWENSAKQYASIYQSLNA